MPLESTGHKEFDAVIQEMVATHRAKNHDYASEEDPLSNFILQAQMTGLSVDMVFFNAIAIKTARLKNLLNSGREPNFESIDDSIKDMAVYSALWASWRKR